MRISDWSSDVCSSDLANDFDDHDSTVSDNRFEAFYDDVADAWRLRLKAGAAFDFEDASTAGEVSVTVTATDRDGAGLSSDQGFSFAITEVNDCREATATGEAVSGPERRGCLGGRSEDGRVGKEWLSTCRARRAVYDEKKNIHK